MYEVSSLRNFRQYTFMFDHIIQFSFKDFKLQKDISEYERGRLENVTVNFWKNKEDIFHVREYLLQFVLMASNWNVAFYFYKKIEGYKIIKYPFFNNILKFLTIRFITNLTCNEKFVLLTCVSSWKLEKVKFESNKVQLRHSFFHFRCRWT